MSQLKCMLKLLTRIVCNKVRKKSKIRNRYNQLPHLTKDTTLESDKTQENIIYKRAKRLALSQQMTKRLQWTYKTAWQTQNINKKKDPQKKHSLKHFNIQHNWTTITKCTRRSTFKSSLHYFTTENETKQCHVASNLLSTGQRFLIQNTIKTQSVAVGKWKVQNWDMRLPKWYQDIVDFI